MTPRFVRVAVLAVVVAAAGNCGGDDQPEISRADRFRTLASERGVLPDVQVDDDAIDFLGEITCDEGVTEDELMIIAQSDAPSVRTQPTA